MNPTGRTLVLPHQGPEGEVESRLGQAEGMPKEGEQSGKREQAEESAGRGEEAGLTSR